MYIFTYFHVYFYLFLHISTYLHIFSAIFMYISTYFHVYFYLFLHIYHKSVAFYHSLAQKCGIIVLQQCVVLPKFTGIYLYLPRLQYPKYLFLPIFTYIYHKSVVFYHSLPQKCDILPQNKRQKTWHFYISAQNARFLALIWR